MNDIAIFRSIFGDFDDLLPVKNIYRDEADFYLVTDKIKTDEYTVINIVPQTKKPRRESRRAKLCPHLFLPDYEYYIYLDGSVQILDSPRHLIKKYLRDYDIAVLKHPWRDCIYQELTVCAEKGYVGKANAEKHKQFLRSEGYPENNGLTENGVILRRNTDRIQHFGEFWAEIYYQFTQRDQHSFCYCAWKMNIKYNLIINDIRNRFPMEFKYHEHKGR